LLGRRDRVEIPPLPVADGARAVFQLGTTSGAIGSVVAVPLTVTKLAAAAQATTVSIAFDSARFEFVRVRTGELTLGFDAVDLSRDAAGLVVVDLTMLLRAARAADGKLADLELRIASSGGNGLIDLRTAALDGGALPLGRTPATGLDASDGQVGVTGGAAILRGAAVLGDGDAMLASGTGDVPLVPNGEIIPVGRAAPNTAAASSALPATFETAPSELEPADARPVTSSAPQTAAPVGPALPGLPSELAGPQAERVAGPAFKYDAQYVGPLPEPKAATDPMTSLTFAPSMTTTWSGPTLPQTSALEDVDWARARVQAAAGGWATGNDELLRPWQRATNPVSPTPLEVIQVDLSRLRPFPATKMPLPQRWWSKWLTGSDGADVSSTWRIRL
jgi:Cohesin domain